MQGENDRQVLEWLDQQVRDRIPPLYDETDLERRIAAAGLTGGAPHSPNGKVSSGPAACGPGRGVTALVSSNHR